MATQIIDGGFSKYQGAPIRVSVSAAAAFNGDGLKKSISNLMEKLGCAKCFSGFDCRFNLQRNYLIDPEYKVQTLENNIHEEVPVVNVRIDRATSHDINRVSSLLEKLRGKFGCLPCHSGFDFRFRNEIRELTIAEL